MSLIPDEISGMDLTQIYAGDSIDQTVDLADYPATDGWAYKVRLTPRFTAPVQTPITLTATTSGTSYVLAVVPTTTAAWQAGDYTVSRWVEKTGKRVTLDGSATLFTVKPDPSATAAGYDPRSSARLALEAIRATLKNKATTAQLSYEIANRKMASYSIAELLMLEKRFAAEVAAEDRANGIVSGEALAGVFRARMVDA